MNLRTKWLAAAGAVIVAGVLCAGVALAAGNGSSLPSRLQSAVQSGKLTQGQAEVLQQLRALRKAAMEKLQSDSKALVDQAVQSGKITQDQANELLRPRFGHHGRHGRLSLDQLKARLDAKVKAGTITQEQANQILQHWTDRQSQGN